ncbi:TniQ family protein [Roseomonas sp. CCTCC AB2023176]|uniref:TniQ family protein n=1 Tax=Roseomonas sp. CCTCC AB2023176 TaxID=3342640 RepID=UPI0035DCDEF9
MWTFFGGVPVRRLCTPGEALSSWVTRLGARYGLSANELLAGLNVPPPPRGRLGPGLDAPPWPALDVTLAEATGREPAEVAALRPVADPAFAGWLRGRLAWCEACVAEDEVRDGEVHLRSAWRTDATAVCARHRRLLRVARGGAAASLSTAPAAELRIRGGRLLLERDPARDIWFEVKGGPRGWEEVAGILFAPGEFEGVARLQEALGRALAGGDPQVRWSGLTAGVGPLPGVGLRAPADLFANLVALASELAVRSGGRPVRALRLAGTPAPAGRPRRRAGRHPLRWGCGVQERRYPAIRGPSSGDLGPSHAPLRGKRRASGD